MHSDEDDWNVDYPLEIVEWLADLMEALNFKFTPQQILSSEAEYPGLLDDIAIIIWQRDILKKQIENG